MTLTFRTPSRTCQWRVYNGSKVEIVAPIGRRKVKRIGWKLAPVYVVRLADSRSVAAWIALGDELFIEPKEAR